MPLTIKNRRQFRNFWLEPRQQLRYGMQFFFFIVGVFALVQVTSYYAVKRTIFAILAEAGENGALQSILDSAIKSALLQMAWVLLPIGVVALWYTARMFHRFIGPMVPIRQFIGKLSAGDYGTECRPLRAKDEMNDLVGELNTLSHSLEERHGNADRRDLREAGFSLVEVVMIVAVIGVLSLIAISQIQIAYDRARQRATMNDMRNIAAANGTYALDNGTFAPTLDDLQPKYIAQIVPVDRWGFAWTYAAAGRTYTLTSTGADGIGGPAAPANWTGDPFEADLILQSGAFSQAPVGIE